MTDAPLLAALLRRALPTLTTLDLCQPASGLFPFLPARLGIPRPGSVTPAEHALLAAFRHPDGTPLLGFAPLRDAALRAGAATAWGGEGPRLVVLPDPQDAPAWQSAGAIVLTTSASPTSTGARILLLIGRGTAPRHLLLPAEAPEPTLAALHEAARTIAADEGGEGGLRRITPTLATLGLLLEATTLPRATVVETRQLPRHADGLRLRLLLGHLSPGRWSLHLTCHGAPEPTLFIDGRPHPATPTTNGLCTTFEPGPAPTILGLMGRPAPHTLTLTPT